MTRLGRTAVLVLACVAMGSAAHAEDLLQIYREALSRDPVLASARSTWLGAQERLPQAQAALLPSVTFSGSASLADTSINIRSTPPATGTRDQLAASLTVSASQPLYRRQNLVVIDQARQQVAQSDLVLASAQQDLILRVAQAYFDVLLAQDNLALAGAQKAAVSEQLAQAKRNFEVGIATITDTNEAQARYDQIVAQEIAAQNDLDNKRAALRSITGRLPIELRPLSSNLALELPPTDSAETWFARAATGNFQVRIAQAALDLAALEIERNRAANDPTLDLVASVRGDTSTGSSTSNVDSSARTASITLQFSMPLYTGGLVNSRMREAIAGQDKARQDLEAARRAAALATQTALLGVTSGAAQVKAFEQALVSSEVSLASSKLGMEVGVRTNLDVLNAQQVVFQTRRDLAQSRYNLLMSTLRLRSSVGELNEGELERVNRALGV